MYSSAHYLLHSGKKSKLLYYLQNATLDLLPDTLFRHRLQQELTYGLLHYDNAYVDDRVDYYCPLSSPLANDAKSIGDFHKHGTPSAYYYDSRDIIRWFPHHLRWDYLFGDNRLIPPTPKIVKSRNLVSDPSNAVLLKLNKCRHYIYVRDKIPFEQKASIAIYRGQIGTRQNRKRFVEMYAANPRVDAANTLAKGALLPDNVDGKATSPRLSIYDHLRYRYIMALEGNDVASNLKWVMSSNSIAVMPRPTCETWFMEGRLQPDVHYIEIKDDFSDLIDKMDYYDAHPALAKQIIANANAYTAQFRNKRRERYIALRVMQKYLTHCNPDCKL